MLSETHPEGKLEVREPCDYQRFFVEDSLILHCLDPLLKALSWHENHRQLVESFPHFHRSLDFFGFFHVLLLCGYDNHLLEKSETESLDERLLPCLYVSEQHVPMIITEMHDGQPFGFNSQSRQYELLNITKSGKYYLFTAKARDGITQGYGVPNWLRYTLREFFPLRHQLISITLVMNFLALATPLFSMMVYDSVIPAGSISLLFQLLFGAITAGIFLMGLQFFRNRFFMSVGAKLDWMVGNSLLTRLLYLTPAFTESATMHAQISRIKDFDSVRDFFTGPLFSLIAELPFSILFVLVIAALGGWLAIVPVFVIVLFSGIIFLLHPMTKRTIKQNAEYSSKKQAFLMQALLNLRTIKCSVSNQVWFDKFRNLCADATLAQTQTQILTTITGALADGMVTLSASGLLLGGVAQILDQKMTVGALIASMILIWRITNPIKTVLTALPRFDQLLESLRQINRLMQLQPEKLPYATAKPIKITEGKVALSRVTMRYRRDREPAVTNITFQANPGEIIAITGRNGSGKSTLLKVLLGLYAPQIGTVTIDGMDVQQYEPVELRHALSYVPQSTELFYGTFAQNIRLANPLATDAEVREALELAGLWEEISRFPQGLATRLRDQRQIALSDSFKQRLGIARAYVKKSKILLLDEPAAGLDEVADAALKRALVTLRGNTTVFMVTHRPSHMELADKIAVLHLGQLLGFGKTAEILPQLMKEYQ